jgi:hypothetical protein
MDHIELLVYCFSRLFFTLSYLNKNFRLSKLVVGIPSINKCKSMANWQAFAYQHSHPLSSQDAK